MKSHFCFTGTISRAARSLAVIISLTVLSFGQIGSVEKSRANQMLSNIKKELEKSYYDPTFHGMNLDERFKAANEKIKTATTLGGTFAVIAQTLVDLNDSHTFFLPPETSLKVEYGWQMGMVGDIPYVIAVKPKSDADKKGLKVGDMVLSVNGFKPTRSELWKVNYYYYTISPRSAMSLIVQSPGGSPRQVDVTTKMTRSKSTIDLTKDLDWVNVIRESESESKSRVHRFQKVGNTAIWKMPSFSFDPAQVDSIMEGRVLGSRNLILDLRGNQGGYVKTMERIASYFFENETKIADVKERKKSEVSKTDPKKTTTFKGAIVVLVDSNSGSASEILARMLQIEKRGTVIGDRTAGAVMQSLSIPMKMGTDSFIYYGMSLTVADVIMTDGKSLEHVGVAPDELLLPTGEEMATSKDTALARALEKLGTKMSPEDAGRFFPTIWDN